MKKEEIKIYIFCIIILILTSFFSSGYHHFDEHFQILEFAGSKLNLTSTNNLSWEYDYQIRPAIQPAIAFCLYNFMEVLGISDPFNIAVIFRLISAFLAFISMFLIYRVYSKNNRNKTLSYWFLLLSFLLWFNIYNGVRFSSENWSGIFFTIAFALFFLIKKQNALFYLTIGFIFGLSFIFRYQSGFLISGFLCWLAFIKKDKIQNIILLLTGIGFVILLGVIADKWFYGEWTITAWNYFEQNIIQDKVSSFSVDPWWWYIEKFFYQGIPPFSILFILSIVILIVFRRKSPITWSLLPFLAIHFVLGHKEMRYLFPIVYFLPIVLINAFEFIQEKYKINLSSLRSVKVFMTIFFIVYFIFLVIITFKPADNQISLYKAIYKNYKNPTTLYYISENPYYRVLDINFYKRKSLTIKRINSLDEINHQTNMTELVVITNKENLPKIRSQNKLIYSSFPDWVLKLNYGNWVERTKVWYVYELGTVE